MVFLNIHTNNFKEPYENRKTMLEVLNNIIEKNDDNKVFILYYMEGCGPCNATRPEWDKLKNILKKYENDKTVAIVDIDQVLSSKVKDAKQSPNSFPTIRFITNKGNIVENYEDSEVENKDRSIDSFVEWIKLKTKNKQNTSNKKGGKINNSKSKKIKGGKWSRKYKRSINCKKPRGFSQKQYCKYSRRK